MNGGVAASDPRVGAILTQPDAYFAEARLRAWEQAHADIEADLDRRARARRNGRLRTEPTTAGAGGP